VAKVPNLEQVFVTPSKVACIPKHFDVSQFARLCQDLFLKPKMSSEDQSSFHILMQLMYCRLFSLQSKMILSKYLASLTVITGAIYNAHYA